MRIKDRICPYCGAELELEYIPSETPVYLYNCCVCGGTFKHTKNELEQMAKEIGRNSLPSKNKTMLCPKCGSHDVGLWNSRKLTYHCHNCDSYFNKYGTIITNSYPVQQKDSWQSKWNGFTDPDNFPTDGFDGGGW